MFIDTHAHLWTGLQDYSRDEIIAKAKIAGVEKIVVPGLDVKTSNEAIALSQKYPGQIFAAVGVHPESMGDVGREIEEVSLLIAQQKTQIVAIGEIGSDAGFEELSNKIVEQKRLFQAQAKLAIEYDLPMIIHTRKTLFETLEWLDQLPVMPRGVFHGFSHDLEGMKQIVARGFVIGIGGNLSYSKRIQKVAQEIPENRFVLETDWPYLPSKLPNEVSSVTMLAQILADCRGEKIEDIGKQTTNTAKALFNI